MHKTTQTCLGILCLFLASSAQAEEKIIRIYQDADLSNHETSSDAIQQGLKLAFDEIGNEIEGYKVEFKYLDHRRNVKVSKQNYETFLADPQALVMFAGQQSPPIISNKDFINEKGALTMVSWAAGGPVTRHSSSDNSIFRLSLDDTRTGKYLVDYAFDKKNCKSPHILAENSPWGDSNVKTMSAALAERGIDPAKVTRFNWGLQDGAARTMLRNIFEANHDCLLMVGALEGATIVQAFLDIGKDKTVPIISHWGITGAEFPKAITAEKRENLDLTFAQTCFSFSDSDLQPHAKEVFERLKKVSGGKINDPKDIATPVGIIHTYDLTKILIAAIKQAGLTGDVAHDRKQIRQALENLETPVQGLIKTYEKPFSTFDPKTNVNAHEALGPENFCMGYYGPQDEILVIHE